MAGLPIIGLFARLAFSAAARRSAASVIARSGTRVIVKRALKPQAKKQLKKTKREMAQNGGFRQVLDEVAGDVSSEVVGRLVEEGLQNKNPQSAIVHTQNPDSDGKHGNVQCLGIIDSKNPRRSSVYLESPEIISLHQLQSDLRRNGNSNNAVARAIMPMGNVVAGQFSYETGHKVPTVFESSEGKITIDSSASSSRGKLTAHFRPNRSSRVQEYYAQFKFVE